MWKYKRPGLVGVCSYHSLNIRALFLAMEEIWKPINGYQGLYAVSNQGRVKSLDRKVSVRNGFSRVYPGRILSPDVCRGYRRVTLRKNNKNVHISVHRLVCEAFHGPCPPGKECMHLNGDRGDNRAKNLKWGAHAENMKDILSRERMHKAAIEGSHDSSKKAVGQFTRDGVMVNCYESLLSASNKTKIPVAHISAVCHGERRSAGGFIWKFLV